MHNGGRRRVQLAEPRQRQSGGKSLRLPATLDSELSKDLELMSQREALELQGGLCTIEERTVRRIESTTGIGASLAAGADKSTGTTSTELLVAQVATCYVPGTGMATRLAMTPPTKKAGCR